METTRDIDVRPSSIALWTGVLAGPIAWLLTLQLKYGLIAYVCDHKAGWILWLVTLLALLLTAFGGFSAWSGLQAAAADGERAENSEGRHATRRRLLDLERIPMRIRFMGIGGLLVSAMFFLAIAAMAIPDLFFRACD